MQLPSPPASVPTSGGRRVVVERPPPGLARGRVSGPRWALAALALLALLLTAGFYLRLARKKRVL